MTSLSDTVTAEARPSKPCSASSSVMWSRAVGCIWWVIVGYSLGSVDTFQGNRRWPAASSRVEFTERMMHYPAGSRTAPVRSGDPARGPGEAAEQVLPGGAVLVLELIDPRDQPGGRGGRVGVGRRGGGGK